MAWMIGASAGLVSVLFIVYLYKNAATVSQLLARRVSRPEVQEFRREEYAWVLLVLLLIVVAVLLLPFIMVLMTRSLSGAPSG